MVQELGASGQRNVFLAVIVDFCFLPKAGAYCPQFLIVCLLQVKHTVWGIWFVLFLCCTRKSAKTLTHLTFNNTPFYLMLTVVLCTAPYVWTVYAVPFHLFQQKGLGNKPPVEHPRGRARQNLGCRKSGPRNNPKSTSTETALDSSRQGQWITSKSRNEIRKSESCHTRRRLHDCLKGKSVRYNTPWTVSEWGRIWSTPEISRPGLIRSSKQYHRGTSKTSTGGSWYLVSRERLRSSFSSGENRESLKTLFAARGGGAEQSELPVSSVWKTSSTTNWKRGTSSNINWAT